MDGQGGDGNEPSNGDGTRFRTDGGTDPLDEPTEGEDPGDAADSAPADAEDGAEASADDGGGLPVSRRAALAGGGLAIALGLGVGVSHVLRPATGVAPDVPREEMESDGWVEVEEVTEPVMEGSAGPVSVEAISHVLRFEDQGLVGEINDREIDLEYRGQTSTERLGDHASDQFDQSMGVFAATKIDLTPHVDELPGGLGRAEVMGQVETQARAQFEQQLEDAGLENPREVDSGTFDVESGQSATLTEYRAEFAFESASFETQGVPVTIPGGTIEIAGHLAIWHDGRDIVVAAGGHPAENHTDTVTETVQGAELTVDLDLGLRPSEFREEIRGYMARVE